MKTRFIEEQTTFLGLAETICIIEAKAVDYPPQAGLLAQWQPVAEELFNPPIALKDICFDPNAKSVSRGSPNGTSISQAEFQILGDEETSVTITRKTDIDVIDDPFLIYFFEKYKNSFVRHTHLFCLENLRNRRIEQNRRELIRTRQQALKVVPTIDSADSLANSA